jgi:hypothetical protein
MPTKGVVDRQRVAEGLIASARTHAQQVGERLQTHLAVVLDDGETLPDLTRLQLLFARLLEQSLDALVSADEDHLSELDDDLEVRQRRDKATAALRQEILDVRGLVRGVFGADWESQVLGLEGRTAQDPLALQRQAERVVERLRKPGETELPAPRVPDVDLDLSRIPGRIVAKLDDLEEALSGVDREEREAESSQLGKDQAVEDFDELATGIADTLRGWSRLAGLPEIADRIRLTPPTRRAAA